MIKIKSMKAASMSRDTTEGYERFYLKNRSKNKISDFKELK